MRSDRLRPTLVLSVVTLLIWTTRIRNIWTDDELDVAGQIGRTALSLSFTAFAVVGVWLWWDARRHRPRTWASTAIRAFALWTTAVWVVRGVQIATAGHEAAFVVVHTVLAVASVALAWWADRAARSLEPASGPGAERATEPATR